MKNNGPPTPTTKDFFGKEEDLNLSDFSILFCFAGVGQIFLKLRL